MLLGWGEEKITFCLQNLVLLTIASQKMFTHLVGKPVVSCIQMFKCGQQCSLVWQPSLPPPDMKVRSYTCHLDKLWPAVVMFLRYETQVQVLETHNSDRAAVDITLNNFFRQISICHWYRELFCTRWCGISFSIETRVYRLWLFSDWVGKYSFWCNLIAVS